MIDLHGAWAINYSIGDVHPQTPLPVQILRPAAAAMGEVVPMGDLALMQMAGELGNAVRPWVVPEEVAGHADLPAAAGAEHCLIEQGLLLDRLLAGGLQP